jgi:hypothetical protein
MTTETENPELRQEDDQVSHLDVILGILVVLAITAVMIVWAWATTNHRLAARRPTLSFPEERLGPRRNVEGVGEAIFRYRGVGEVVDSRPQRVLEAYRWIDPKRRIVTLPIELAMDRIAEESAR